MSGAARFIGPVAAILIIGFATYRSIVPDSGYRQSGEPPKAATAAGQPGQQRGGDRSASSVTLNRAQLDMIKVGVVKTQTFAEAAGSAVASPSVPDSAIVREPDGSMAVWVMTDLDRFDRRTVRLGIQRGGSAQILEGLRPGEFIAVSGAQLVSNTRAAAPR